MSSRRSGARTVLQSFCLALLAQRMPQVLNWALHHWAVSDCQPGWAGDGVHRLSGIHLVAPSILLGSTVKFEVWADARVRVESAAARMLAERIVYRVDGAEEVAGGEWNAWNQFPGKVVKCLADIGLDVRAARAMVRRCRHGLLASQAVGCVAWCFWRRARLGRRLGVSRLLRKVWIWLLLCFPSSVCYLGHLPKPGLPRPIGEIHLTMAGRCGWSCPHCANWTTATACAGQGTDSSPSVICDVESAVCCMSRDPRQHESILLPRPRRAGAAPDGPFSRELLPIRAATADLPGAWYWRKEGKMKRKETAESTGVVHGPTGNALSQLSKQRSNRTPVGTPRPFLCRRRLGSRRLLVWCHQTCAALSPFALDGCGPPLSVAMRTSTTMPDA